MEFPSIPQKCSSGKKTDLGSKTQGKNAFHTNKAGNTNKTASTNKAGNTNSTNTDRFEDETIEGINECKSKFILIKYKKIDGVLYDPTIIVLSVA